MVTTPALYHMVELSGPTESPQPNVNVAGNSYIWNERYRARIVQRLGCSPAWRSPALRDEGRS
jgi:hypothetical protein